MINYEEKPRYKMYIQNYCIAYDEPILIIIDTLLNNEEYRLTAGMIIGMAKKEGLINDK